MPSRIANKIVRLINNTDVFQTLYEQLYVFACDVLKATHKQEEVENTAKKEGTAQEIVEVKQSTSVALLST